MSERVVAIIRNRRFADTTLKHVLKRLAVAAQDDGSRINISTAVIAEDSDLTTRTVQRVLRKTGKLGILRLMCRELGPLARIYNLDVSYLTTYPLTAVGRRREEHLAGGP